MWHSAIVEIAAGPQWNSQGGERPRRDNRNRRAWGGNQVHFRRHVIEEIRPRRQDVPGQIVRPAGCRNAGKSCDLGYYVSKELPHHRRGSGHARLHHKLVFGPKAQSYTLQSRETPDQQAGPR